MKKKFLTLAMAAVMTVASAVNAFAATSVDAVESITGDVTVTAFFGEKSNAVELKDGDTLTIKFNNKSNGTNNYDNFLVVVAGEGALADEYPNPGGPVEALAFRADAWGWGGELSDVVAPDGATDNKLVFESDINWDNWAAAMAAGVDCEVKLVRTGDKIDYTAKIGEWTVSTSATSGKALPESLYVFLTGENCSLTGISSTKTSAQSESEAPTTTKTEDDTTVAPEETTTQKTTPATGDASNSVVLFAVAAAAVAGVVVLKKKTVTE